MLVDYIENNRENIESEGLNVFPKEWSKFIKALTKLIGKKLC